MKSILAASISLLLTVLGCYLAFNNSWWLILVFTIVCQNAWSFFIDGGGSFRTAKVYKDRWHVVQTFVSLLCSMYMAVFMFVFVQPWWAILIMVVVNIAMPLIFIPVTIIASGICSLIPNLLFKD